MKQIAITGRIIEIPPEVLSYIGVAGDTNSTVITFKMHRYADGVDLSEKDIKIAYINAAGESDYDDASNITIIDDGYFTFEWVLSGKAMADAGTVKAAIEISSINEYGEKDYIWKTRPTTFSITDSIGLIENNANDSDHYYQILFYDTNDNSSVYAISDDGAPIQIVSRDIIMPDVSGDIAVEQDSNSQILTFTLPRYYQNTDLSQKVISIKYKNAKGESDRSRASNVIVEENTIHFGWLLSGSVTSKSGIVRFAIEFLGYNEKEEFYCWSTKPAQFYVEEGLNVDEQLIPPNPTWIQSWWVEMDSALKNANEQSLIARQSAESAEESAEIANSSKEAAESAQKNAEQDRMSVEEMASVVLTVGDAVKSGKSPQIGENGNWFIWDTDGYVDSGERAVAEDGNDGKSAYQQAVDGGYTGTQEEFELILSQIDTVFTRMFTATLSADGWIQDGEIYKQQISVPDGIIFLENDRADFDTDIITALSLPSGIVPINDTGILYAETVKIPDFNVDVQVSLTKMKIE